MSQSASEPQTIFTNAYIVLADEVIHGTLVIEGGLIVAIDQGGTAHGLDCGGDYICAGLIELHTDNLERHMSPRPGVKWPLRAAILGHDRELAGVGITTVFDALRVGSVLSKKARYGKYARGLADQILAMRAQQVLSISHLIHLRAEICSETLIEELEEFSRDDTVGIVSLMDHTPGQRQFSDIEKHKQYVCGKYGFSDADYAEHLATMQDLQARNGAGHEAFAVKAGHALGAVLASHDDTTADHVAISAGHGIKLAEFPTTLEAAAACRANGIKVMAGAPNLMRGQSHSGNVSAQDLAKAGLLDILSSDYVPSALICAAVALGLKQGDLAFGLRTVTNAPAQAVNLADRGRLAVGLRADLVRFRLFGDVPQVLESWVSGKRVA